MITNVGEWLRKSPTPSTVKCKCLDGETRTIKIDAQSKVKWRSAEAAIDAMGAMTLEALDAKGNTIRLTELEVRDLEPREETPVEVPKGAGPNASDFSLYAKLLAQAYKDGAASVEAPTRLAFETLGQLLQFMMRKVEDLDARDRAQVNAALKVAQGQDVTPEESPLMSLVSQFMTGMHAGKAISNGAASPDAPEEQ